MRLLFTMVSLVLLAGGVNLRAGTVAPGPGGATALKAMGLLKANCVSCHNDEKRKGGLRLTSREDLLKGGDNGPVLVPGQAEKSKLNQVVLADADPHMPPKKQLSTAQIGLLRNWINAGAPWDAQALAETTVAATLEKLGALPAGYQPALALGLSRDGKALAVGRGSRISVYDVGQTNRSLVGELEGHRDAVQSLAWSPDGERLVSGGFRQIIVWDARNKKRIGELTNGLTGRVTALEFLPDGKTLVIADGESARSGWIRLWKPGAPKPEADFEAHRDTIFALKVSRDGKSLATAGADKLVKVWNLAERKETARLEGHTGHIMALAFNEDDSWLASAGTDKEIKIWDIKTRDKIIGLGQHGAPVTGLNWTPDGKRLVAACEDGTVATFTEFKTHKGGENSEGATMRKLSEADQMLYCVTASADGKVTYAGAYDGSVFVWDSRSKMSKLAAPEAGQTTAKPAEKTALAK